MFSFLISQDYFLTFYILYFNLLLEQFFNKQNIFSVLKKDKTRNRISKKKGTFDVMDQKEWIEKVRNVTDGSFAYLTYAVPKSSELFNPYMLR